MSKRAVIDGDTAEETTLDDRDPLPHCFIVRLDDELLSVVLRHQNRLARLLEKNVSRAAAVREVLRRALPKRQVPKVRREQLTLFGLPQAKDPSIMREARRVVRDVEKRTIER